MIDDLRQLTNEYNMLRANSRAQLDRVEALSDCLKRVEDIERQVKNSLDEIEQNAEYLSKHRSKDKLRNDLVKQVMIYLMHFKLLYSLSLIYLKLIISDQFLYL